jgi:alkanesulfonate monooxygenase SsuD/methylene tetrahydromethanopterin reductase-like flavin-dependent oxidoreductase (luciferase family)
MTPETRLGVLLPTAAAQWATADDPRDLIQLAVRAERIGFDSIWANDSLLQPRIEPLTALAAAAAVTERITLGTAALLPAFRRPVVAAQAIGSLDLLSGGRLVLAVGAGFPGRSEIEYRISEVPWDRRFARLDDTVGLWRALWSAAGPTDFAGRELRFTGVPAAVRTHRPGGPPIWLGGATPAALARTGRLYDGWLPYPPEPAAYAVGLAAVRDAARAAGRGGSITPALFATVLVADDVDTGRRALDTFCRANYGRPLAAVERIQVMATGPLDRVAAQLARYTAVGARHLVLRVAAADLASYRDQLDQLATLAARL